MERRQRHRDLVPPDVAGLIELATSSAGAFDEVDCYQTEQLESTGLACEHGRYAGWFWNDDGDAIRAVYVHDGLDDLEAAFAPIEGIVLSIRAP